jgi:hypothetical protein
LSNSFGWLPDGGPALPVRRRSAIDGPNPGFNRRLPDEALQREGKKPTARVATPSSTTAIVWATKYRCQALTGKLRLWGREIIRQVCDELDVEIVKGALSKDHVHIIIAVPSNLSALREADLPS